MRAEGLRMAAALGPECGAAEVFREWAEDSAYRRVQLAALLAGHPVSVNARGPDRICGLGPVENDAGADTEVEVLYSVSARPIRRPATSRLLQHSP
ncbi:hypothetical protein [Streptomyces otsuchiensis]|uniref:hypothetical protein n=1 Tax=Streptomyces otsuchiensis TaxID=2681388 RepID=UPI001032018D|nr:hypothetical protein [Streptomyces otsuchiensis]